jgi:hypothetical protein
MKLNRLLVYLVSAILLSSCSSQKYLPNPKEVGLSPYGSFIKVHSNNHVYQGEFLALSGDSLVILSVRGLLEYVDTTSVSKYFIQFCKTPNYDMLPLISFTHGFFMVITVPVNLLVAIIMESKDRKESRYRDLPFSLVGSYARFPPGLPEGFIKKPSLIIE